MGTYNGTSGNDYFTAKKEGGTLWWGEKWRSWTMSGNGGNDNLTGGPMNDIINGNEGTDVLYGKDGHDTLTGGIGSDNLFGEGGNDYLNGFGGGTFEYDYLSGGTGSDKFILGDQSGVFYLGSSHAIITDFNWTEIDKFQAYGSIYDYSLGTLNWYGGSAPDTGIYYNGDLIGVVQDKSGTDVLLTEDFTFVG